MPEIRGIVHDWDDTAAQGFEHYKHFYMDFAQHYGLNPPQEANLKKSWGQTIPHIAHDQWPEIAYEKVVEMVTKYLPIRQDNREVKVFAGVRQTIEKLSEKYLLAVLSSGNFDQIMATYRAQISPTQMFHEIIVAPPKYSIKKDHPDVLQPIMTVFAQKGVKSVEMLMVGDHPYDKLAADSQGLLFIAVTTGITTREDFLQLGVPEENILNSFNDIFTVLER